MAQSIWRPVTSAVLLGSVLSTVEFNSLGNNLDEGIDCTLSKLTDYSKVRVEADAPEVHAAIRGILTDFRNWLKTTL